MEVLYCDFCKSRVSQGELAEGEALAIDEKVICPDCVRKSKELQQVLAEQQKKRDSGLRPAAAPRQKKHGTTAARLAAVRPRQPTVALGVVAAAGGCLAVVLVWLSSVSPPPKATPKARTMPRASAPGLGPAHGRRPASSAMRTRPAEPATDANASKVPEGSGDAAPGAPARPVASAEPAGIEVVGGHAEPAGTEGAADAAGPPDAASPPAGHASPPATGTEVSPSAIKSRQATQANVRGVEAARAGNAVAAESAFREAVSLNSSLCVAYNNLGSILLEQGNIEEAEKQLLKAIELEPRFAEAYLNLGLLRASQWRYAEANTYIARGLELAPHREEEIDGVLSEIDTRHMGELGEKGPENLEQTLWLVRKTMKEGKWAAAVRLLNNATKLDPESAEIRFLKGLVYEETDKPMRAVGAYLQAVQVDPRHFRALNNMAWIYATAEEPPLRNPNLALRYARRANEICGGTNPIVLDTLARSLAATGNREEALKMARKAVELSPNDKEITRFLEEMERAPATK